ncbi:MAG: DUF1580 domain-containing protein [Planctomycetes bacterium]|nr:DUF1580 domain-containing protein [Planctomycetota bacterium]
MELDLINDRLIALSEVPEMIPPGRGGKRTHLKTVERWIANGVRLGNGERVRLEVVQLAGRRLTTAKRLAAFIEKQTEVAKTKQPAKAAAVRYRFKPRSAKQFLPQGTYPPTPC